MYALSPWKSGTAFEGILGPTETRKSAKGHRSFGVAGRPQQIQVEVSSSNIVPYCPRHPWFGREADGEPLDGRAPQVTLTFAAAVTDN